MTKTMGARTGIRVAAVAAAAALLLASCSSEPTAEESLSPSASLPASSAAPVPSASAVAATDAASMACAAYFELDLLNSSYAGGAVADGDMTEEQVRADFTRLLKELVAQAKVATSEGLADEKLLINAKKMKKTVKALEKNAALSDLSAKKKEKFVKQSVRVQKACDRAGYPLPEDNVTARTAAGL